MALKTTDNTRLEESTPMSYTAILEARRDAENQMQTLKEALRLRQEKEAARAKATRQKPEYGSKAEDQ
jgi:hypothetical protein